MLFLGIETNRIFIMKKTIFTLALASMIGASLQAQTFLEGNVLDSKTGEMLPFVNIAISGTNVGTTSDLNGEFKLQVPANMMGRELTFSSVGFNTVTYSISQVSNQHVSVKLEPMDLKLEEVVVTDKSEAGRRVVKNVLENVSSKYVDRDFSYQGTYRNVYTCNGKSRTADYSFSAYDSHGYSRSQGNNAFQALNYKFGTPVKRDFKVDDYPSGLNYFDFVSGLDFMRYQLGVMNTFTLKDFDFKIKSETPEVYVIDFKCNHPSLLNTGAYLPTAYTGTIHIRKADNVVMETQYVLSVRNLNMAGMSLRAGADGQSATIICAIRYENFQGKYAMKEITSKVEIKGAPDGDITIDDDITVNSVNHKAPAKISGKVFYTR